MENRRSGQTDFRFAPALRALGKVSSRRQSALGEGPKRRKIGI